MGHGKGGAVRKGAMRASGEWILMADADGATKFADIEKIEKALKPLQEKSTGTGESAFVGIGSRAHMEDESIAKRSPLRTFLMHGFHQVVAILGVQGIRDTQCGFKFLNRKAAQLTFAPLHIERWAFDVELLYLAQKNDIPIEEVAVNWHEIDGSKLSVVDASLTMLRDLALMRFCYITGLWKKTDGGARLHA